MYFQNYRPLLKCLKGPVSENPSTVNMLKGPKHCWNVQISIFILFFWSIRQKLSCKTCLLVISEILGLCANTLTANGIYSLDKREVTTTNWNVNSFSTFLKNRWASQLMYFRNYGFAKTLLLTCLKGLYSENPSAVNMLKVTKHCWKLQNSAFTLFLITLGEIEFENASLSYSWNLRTHC